MPVALAAPSEWTSWNAIRVMAWTCPERWTAAERTFRPHGPIGWLGAPMDFMNSAGVLCPIELCGLSQLYKATTERPQDRRARGSVSVAPLGGVHRPA